MRHTNTHSNANRNPDADSYSSTQSDATTSPDTAPSPDTAAVRRAFTEERSGRQGQRTALSLPFS